jgi:hypothetical protein
MKNLSLLSFFSLLTSLFFSCNKTSSPNLGPAIQDSLPNSFTIYLPQIHSKSVEIFEYNTQAQLVTLNAYSYDSSSGTPVIDSFFVSFTLNQATNPPSAYDEAYHYQGDPPAGESEHHELLYDVQNRVTTDSITVSSVNNYAVQHYKYDNNGNTTIEWLFGFPQTPSSYVVNQIDTMFVQNENIMTDINYNMPGAVFNRLFTRSYSTHVNPLYNTALANSLGCLMVFNNFFDFRSEYLPTQFSDQENNSPVITINYLWAVDATFRVISGVGTDATSGLTQQIYTFTY